MLVVGGNLVEICFLKIVCLLGLCINLVVDLLLNCLFVIKVYCFRVFLFLKFYKIFLNLNLFMGFGKIVFIVFFIIGFLKNFLIFFKILFFLEVMLCFFLEVCFEFFFCL